MNRYSKQSHDKPCNRWIKSALCLGLLIILQALLFCQQDKLGKSIIPSFKSTTQQLYGDIDNIKNISRPMDGTTWLHVAVRDAVKTNNLKKLKVVLDRIDEDIKAGRNAQYENGFPNSIDKKGMTPLGEAIKAGSLSVVTILISKNYIDVNKVGHALTSLLLALNKKHREIAECLLNCPGIDMASKDPGTGETPLHIAIRRQFGACVKKLVEKLVAQNQQDALLVKDKEERAPLDVAAVYNNPYAFRRLFERMLARFPDKVPEILFKKDRKGHSLFALAYLPVPYWFMGMKLSDDEDSDTMFKHMLGIVKDYLKGEEWEKILDEIKQLQAAKTLNTACADQLRGIVENVRPGSNKSQQNPGDLSEEKDLITFD